MIFLTTGYCVKCRMTVDMVSTEEVVMKNKKKAVKGWCSKCGTELYRIKKDTNSDYW